ncbi:LOW QUALITY PROTEIN: extensin-like [Portunus trituberculatus]|uniref:LOW QUALITY PROTEIN: extensin-like n=1 Tax=Portunus trituberculatus TaxID=210409 RepID=UPI001E1D0E43|nr:LOW QUALITY PROTEIN: extensin-like [Portunus trituberculatus]
MALRVLVVVALVGVAASESVSHVSISFSGQQPVSYKVRQHARHAAHEPPDAPRKPPKTTTYATPAKNPTQDVTEPPDTPATTHSPSSSHPTPASAPITPASAPYARRQQSAPPNSRPEKEHPSPPRPSPPYHLATSHAAAPHYSLAHASPYSYAPSYRLSASPHYTYVPSYDSKPVYHSQSEIPACAEVTNGTYCTEDEEYPKFEIKQAIRYHLDKFNHLYADVADLNTELSVEGPEELQEENYLCPSVTAYVKPLRAKNTEGKWRVVVNNVDIHYETVTQTARVEDCLTAGDPCPKVPHCYDSKCLQKSIYHRFLVYDPYDQYFPFAVETFKLPSSCACLLGASTLDQ